MANETQRIVIYMNDKLKRQFKKKCKKDKVIMKHKVTEWIENYVGAKK